MFTHSTLYILSEAQTKDKRTTRNSNSLIVSDTVDTMISKLFWQINILMLGTKIFSIKEDTKTTESKKLRESRISVQSE